MTWHSRNVKVQGGNDRSCYQFNRFCCIALSDHPFMYEKGWVKKCNLLNKKTRTTKTTSTTSTTVNTISVDVHGTGVALPVVVCVDLSGVVFVGAVVTAVTHVVFVIVKLPGVVQEGAVVLKGVKRRLFEDHFDVLDAFLEYKGLFGFNIKRIFSLFLSRSLTHSVCTLCLCVCVCVCVCLCIRTGICEMNNILTLSSRIPSLSSSLSQASPCPSLSKSSCPEFGRLGQLSCVHGYRFHQ